MAIYQIQSQTNYQLACNNTEHDNQFDIITMKMNEHRQISL